MHPIRYPQNMPCRDPPASGRVKMTLEGLNIPFAGSSCTQNLSEHPLETCLWENWSTKVLQRLCWYFSIYKATPHVIFHFPNWIKDSHVWAIDAHIRAKQGGFNVSKVLNIVKAVIFKFSAARKALQTLQRVIVQHFRCPQGRKHTANIGLSKTNNFEPWKKLGQTNQLEISPRPQQTNQQIITRNRNSPQNIIAKNGNSNPG